jgi:hypothetical protein
MGVAGKCSPRGRTLRKWKGAVKRGARLLSAGAATLMLLAPGMPAAAQAPTPNPLFANAVWVGESEGVLKLLAANGSLLLEVSGLVHVRAVVIDDHRYIVWVATDESLLGYGFDGTRQLAVVLQPQGGGSRALLAVNTTDGSLCGAALGGNLEYGHGLRCARGKRLARPRAGT